MGLTRIFPRPAFFLGPHFSSARIFRRPAFFRGMISRLSQNDRQRGSLRALAVLVLPEQIVYRPSFIPLRIG
jgi:hypothetical protein